MTISPSVFDRLAQETVDENTSSQRLQELAQISIELARLVATNPNALPELLKKLSKFRDAITRQNVAINPNTPIDALLKLGEQFPGELLNNPIFSLLLLENLSFLAEIPYHTLKILLNYELDNLSVADTDVGVKNNFFLVQVAKSNKYGFCLTLAQHPHSPVAVLEHLTGDKDKDVRIQVAKNPNTPIHLLEVLAQDLDIYVRCIVAENRITSVATLQQLAQDNSIDVRRSIAGNPNTPVASLEQLARDGDKSVRCRVARNCNTPVAILEQFAQDEHIDVRCNVASNANTPVAILEQFARDENIFIRYDLARNPNTPAVILEQLARDEHIDVRRHVAGNPNTPVKTLKFLHRIVMTM